MWDWDGGAGMGKPSLPAPALAPEEPAPPKYGVGISVLGQRGKAAVSKSW